jgi:putative transposase
MSTPAAIRKLAPQTTRTFFITTNTWGRRSLFQTDRMCQLFMDVLQKNRQLRRFELHEFVVMSEHIHLLITPAAQHSLEKCTQFIKGGFSFRAKKELGFNHEVWMPGSNEHRVKDGRDYAEHVRYIRENPVKAGLVTSPQEFRFSSASGLWELDPAPAHFQG